MAAGEASGTAPAWFRELAPRERSIVLLLAAGNSNKEIASKLGIAEQTVKNRLGLIYERLGVRDRVSAALIVSRARLRDDGSRLFTANSGE
jgi:DNA-binding NarL/FixJ family response regulator